MYPSTSPYVSRSSRLPESMNRQYSITKSPTRGAYESTYASNYKYPPLGATNNKTETYSKRDDFYHTSRSSGFPRIDTNYGSSMTTDRTKYRSLDRNVPYKSAMGVSAPYYGSRTDLNKNSNNIGKSSEAEYSRPRDLDSDLRNMTITRNNNHYSSPGEVGLDNLGNTCFMNSIIQCLSHTRPLLTYMRNKQYLDESHGPSNREGKVIHELGTIFDELWESRSLKSSVKPSHFKDLIEKASGHFSGYDQQDAQEFLLFLLDVLHQEVNKCRGAKNGFNMDELDKLNDEDKAQRTWEIYITLDDSFFVDQFVGLLKTTMKCQKCNKTSSRFEPFWDLSLPLPKERNEVTLADCFNLFTHEELLSGEEEPLCSYCKEKNECSMRLSLHRLPKILVIHLKRFSIGSTRSKVNKFVNFPHKLDIGSYVDNINASPSGKYHLYGVTNHVGTAYAGHYTAHCKTPDIRRWHTFSDSNVRSIAEASVISSDAYILFYELMSS